MPVFLEPNICILTYKITVWIHAHFIMREFCTDSQAPTGVRSLRVIMKEIYDIVTAHHLQTHKHTNTHTHALSVAGFSLLE